MLLKQFFLRLFTQSPSTDRQVQAARIAVRGTGHMTIINPKDIVIPPRSPYTAERMRTICLIELLCEQHHTLYLRLLQELQDHPSRPAILEQQKLAWIETRQLLRNISLLDTELDPNRGQVKILGNSNDVR